METNKAISFQQALHYLNIEHYDQAIPILHDILSDNPNNGYGFYLLGRCYYGKNNFKDAVQAFQEALNYGYTVEKCFYFLGQTYMSMKRYDEAEDYYYEALHVNPQHVETLASYGLLNIVRGRTKKGNQLIDQAVLLEPQNSIVLESNFLRCLSKKNKDKYKALEQFFIYSDDEARKLIIAGMADLYNGSFRSGRDNFRQAYVLAPTDKYVFVLLKQVEELCRNPFSFGFLYKIFPPTVARFIAVVLVFAIMAVSLLPILQPFLFLLVLVVFGYAIFVKFMYR